MPQINYLTNASLCREGDNFNGIPIIIVRENYTTIFVVYTTFIRSVYNYFKRDSLLKNYNLNSKKKELHKNEALSFFCSNINLINVVIKLQKKRFVASRFPCFLTYIDLPLFRLFLLKPQKALLCCLHISFAYSF